MMANSKFLNFLVFLFLLVCFKVTGSSSGELSAHSHGVREIQDGVSSVPAMVASMMGGQHYGTHANINFQDQLGPIDNFDWSMSLDNENKYELDWNYNYTGNSITFALRINQNTSNFRKGLDIFAIGFSSDSSGSLHSADFCLVWFDLSHRIHLQDARTNLKGVIKLIDESESVCRLISDNSANQEQPKEVEVSRKQRHHHRHTRNRKRRVHQREQEEFRVVFSRPLDVCSATEAYYMIDNGTTHLVWFSLQGPLITIDGLNLTELSTRKLPVQTGSLLEWGLNRVQLIASRPPLQTKLYQSGSSSSYADSRGDFDVNSGEDLEADEESETMQSHEIKLDKFQVPARETIYWCKLFKLPKRFLSRKFHITRYGPAIEAGNEHVVHHMELFNCANLNPQQEVELERLHAEAGGWSGECGDLSKRPKETLTCKKVIMAWAMGARPLEYPDLVGQSIGGHGYSPYVVLEVHYNNPKATGGIVDSSGLNFRYTNKLRPYEAGILEVGLEYTDKYAIPPNLITPLAGHCVSECTRVGFSSSTSDHNSRMRNSESDQKITSGGRTLEGAKRPLKMSADGIYIFAAQLHTHLTGVASWTELVRGGKLLGELQRDDHYSPHFQEIRYLPEPVHLVPGDALIHYCLYDTRERVNVTLGGEATSDEMCVTYIHYYPRLELEVCKSSVDSEALEAYFGYLAREENQPTSMRLSELESSRGNHRNDEAVSLKTVSENYRSIEWTRRRSEELIRFYAEAPLSVQCNRSNGDRFPGPWNGIPPTRLWQDDTGQQASELFSEQPMSNRQSVAYRGRNRGRRHAQCARLASSG